jgi:S1-C subfamily serine protease
MARIDDDYPPPYRPARTAQRFPWGAVLLLAVVLAAGGVAVWLLWPRSQAGADEAPPAPIVARGDEKEEQRTNIAVYEKAAPSVVHVTRLAAVRDRATLSLEKVPAGSGSGFVWDNKGHIVTNYHVIEKVSFGVSVTLADGSTWPAQVIDAYPNQDLAVLWIAAPKDKLRPITVGSSHDLQVGQRAFAIGNPFGLDQTLTTGVVSALGREIQSPGGRRIKGVIQTSAPINPGNSGGPLLDSAGRLIGVTTAIVSPSGASAGVGFAIPADDVNRIVSGAVAKPQTLRAALGVTLAPDDVRQQLGVKGPLILDVLRGSAAEKAGLRPTRLNQGVAGDEILAIGPDAVNSRQEILKALAKHKVGEPVAVTIRRNERLMTVTVTLEAAH